MSTDPVNQKAYEHLINTIIKQVFIKDWFPNRKPLRIMRRGFSI
jgi:hypothetical protein